MSNTLWVEAYRPKNVDEYVFRDPQQRKQVLSWIKEKTIPHLLLSGVQGTGKTALAKVLIKELGIEDYDVLEINASRENNVDTIREKIINFIQMIPFGPFKIVLLDEADFLSIQAQAILRGAMETYSAHSRFILTCNYPNKILPALHSRCQGFHIERTDQTEFTARVATILVNENVDFDLDTLDVYVKLTYPDLRKCINAVQQNSVDKKLRAPTNDSESANDYKLEMIQLFKQGKIKEARTLICGKIRPEEIEELYSWLYQNINLLGKTEEQKDSAILILKQGLCDHTICADPELNLSATLVKLARNFG